MGWGAYVPKGKGKNKPKQHHKKIPKVFGIKCRESFYDNSITVFGHLANEAFVQHRLHGLAYGNHECLDIIDGSPFVCSLHFVVLFYCQLIGLPFFLMAEKGKTFFSHQLAVQRHEERN